MRTAAAAAALAACLVCSRSAAADEGARADTVRLMDRVLADPSDAAAKKDLGAAASRAAAAERKAAAAERAALMAEAERARAANAALDSAKGRRVSLWERRFSRACSLAGGADTAREAVEAYEDLLEGFPVYSDSMPLLESSSKKIRGIFFETIKSAYPYLAQGRDSADERMLSALVFSRASERQAEIGGTLPAGLAEAQLKRAERLRTLEARLKLQHKSLAEALSLYSRKRWTEALDYFDEVLAFDRENEEAKFYRGLANAKAAAERKKR